MCFFVASFTKNHEVTQSLASFSIISKMMDLDIACAFAFLATSIGLHKFRFAQFFPMIALKISLVVHKI